MCIKTLKRRIKNCTSIGFVGAVIYCVRPSKSTESKRPTPEEEFDLEYGFILKYGIDTEENYNRVKAYCVSQQVQYDV